MNYIAKLFKNGRSQAVRLPAEFRFNEKEVYVRRDSDTGDIILSRKPSNWSDYFDLLETLDIPADYMADRKDEPTQPREIF